MSVVQILNVKLQRADQSVSWGFNIQGGIDQNMPIMIIKVNPQSLADRCSMRAGDYIIKIGNTSTEFLSSHDCRETIIKQGNDLSLTLFRGAIPKHDDYLASFQFPQPQLMNAHVPTPMPSLSPQVGVQLATNKALLTQSYNSPVGLYSSKNIADTMTAAIKSSNPTYDPPPQLARSYPQFYHSAPTHGPHGFMSAAPTSPREAVYQQQPAYSHPPPTPSSPVGYQAPSSPRSPVQYQSSPPMPQPRSFAPSSSRAPVNRGSRGSALFNQPNTSKVPTCASCTQLIRGPFVSAVGKIWCPNHFVCAQPSCGMSLQDVGFVEEGGKLYCEKDYEQYFAPRCYKCKTPVMSECCYALEKAFHPDCFTCGYCKQKIGNGSFHMEDGVPYCAKDFAALFSTKCAGCEFPIEAGDKFTEALNGHWHLECFVCSTCQQPLTNGFVNKNSQPYCKKHATSFR